MSDKPNLDSPAPLTPVPQEICRAVKARLSEFLDTYAVIGFVAGSLEPVMVLHYSSPKDQVALDALVAAVADAGIGSAISVEQDGEDEKKD